ncbi:MAG: PaaI family thioesterase [Chloroflexi bacterium]|nr:MAG: PaaI family thioesterase [Chloroflexota bacterium]
MIGPRTSAPRTSAEWEATPFFREYHLRVDAIGEGYARLAARRESIKLRGARDGLNGGIVASLGEAAMRVCLASMLGDGERAGLTRELTVAFLSSARGDTSHVEARMMRKGGTLAVGDIELRNADTGELNAKIRVSCEVHRASSTPAT